MNKRTKHIEIKYAFVKDLVERKEIRLQYIKTHSQTADVLTKALGPQLLAKHRDSLGLVSVEKGC